MKPTRQVSLERMRWSNMALAHKVVVWVLSLEEGLCFPMFKWGNTSFYHTPRVFTCVGNDYMWNCNRYESSYQSQNQNQTGVQR